MEYKIGIYGSAVNKTGAVKDKAIELGKELAKYDITLITGGGHGLPYLVAETAAKAGRPVWGFPPVTTQEGLKRYMPDVDISIYSRLTYIPQDFAFVENLGACKQYRNIISTANTDAGIFIAGRWGAMSEFISLFEMGKVCGILTGTDGITDEVERLSKKFNKETQAKVIFQSSPRNLVKAVIKELDK